MSGRQCQTLIVLLLGTAPLAADQRGSALLLGQQFSGLSSQFLFSQIEGQPAVMCSPGSQESRAEARLDLPADARLLGWQARAIDTSDTFDLGLELIERCRPTDAPASLEVRSLGVLGSSGEPGAVALQQVFASAQQVDTAHCSYAVRADFRAGHGPTLSCAEQGVQLQQVRLDYTTAAVLPTRGRAALEGSALQREQFANTWTTTALAQRHCLATSQGAYFTTRIPLPDGALPLALHAWIEDTDPVWSGEAALVEHCRDAGGELHTRPLAQLATAASQGAEVLSASITNAAVVDQRSCALVVINSVTVGDPCASEQIRYGRMAVDYRLGPLFADGFETLPTPAVASQPVAVIIDGQDLLGLSSGFRYSQDGLQQGMSCIAGATDPRAEARVELPAGSSLSSWRAWVHDSSAAVDVRLELIERCRELAQPALLDQRVVGTLQSSGGSGAQLLQQAINPAWISDLEHCTYAVRADFAAGSGACVGAAIAVLQVRAEVAPLEP